MAEVLKEAAESRAQDDARIRRDVSEMLLRIERDGERAVREYSRSLDGWDPPDFRVGAAAILHAADELDDELKTHIAFALDQVRAFASRQRDTLQDLRVETLPGVVLGHRHVPVTASGAYVPGGRYPMLASSFMTVAVPKVAGVGRVVACAPPRAGKGIHPAMLYAMDASGADEIVCLGGVQALATMAFGLLGVEPVDLIVGAGNAYVAEAKRQLFGRVGIDLLAGPTEVVVIADDTADADLVAADLLGQAEHGPTSPAVLITTSRELGLAVVDAVERALLDWPTREIAAEAWQREGRVLVARDRDEAVELSDQLAPEHLELQVAAHELDAYAGALRNYGSLFVGADSTVAYGDKAVGTNHVLPTAGAARYTGGLWVGKFLKTLTFQELTEEGTRRVAPAVAAISHAEGFGGHARTAELRLERAGAAQ
ncbi:MAG TPA: histidinol dehydrogenase [Solirubrobacter sp.]|nr:histidinol dehydrogenase [Solirubrobacter sp.]